MFAFTATTRLTSGLVTPQVTTERWSARTAWSFMGPATITRRGSGPSTSRRRSHTDTTRHSRGRRGRVGDLVSLRAGPGARVGDIGAALRARRTGGRTMAGATAPTTMVTVASPPGGRADGRPPPATCIRTGATGLPPGAVAPGTTRGPGAATP